MNTTSRLTAAAAERALGLRKAGTKLKVSRGRDVPLGRAVCPAVCTVNAKLSGPGVRAATTVLTLRPGQQRALRVKLRTKLRRPVTVTVTLRVAGASGPAVTIRRSYRLLP